METIDYLQKLIDWNVDADAKFIYVKIDNQTYRIQLNGKPNSIQDPNLDFDCIQMSIGNYQLNKYYYIKDGKVYQSK